MLFFFTRLSGLFLVLKSQDSYRRSSVLSCSQSLRGSSTRFSRTHHDPAQVRGDMDEDLIRDRAAYARNVFNRIRRMFLGAYDDDMLVESDVGNVGDIYRGDVHTHATNDGTF